MRDVKYNNYPDWVNTDPFFEDGPDEPEIEEQDERDVDQPFARFQAEPHLSGYGWRAPRPHCLPKRTGPVLVKLGVFEIVDASKYPDWLTRLPFKDEERVLNLLARFSVYKAKLIGDWVYAAQGSDLETMLEVCE